MRAPDPERRYDVVAVPFAGVGSGTTVALLSGRGWLRSATVTNDNLMNAAGSVVFSDPDPKGEQLFRLRLPVLGTVPYAPGAPGLPLESGLSITVESGPVSGLAVIILDTR